jgi:uncharacterized protein YbjT (DUF2867 family)
MHGERRRMADSIAAAVKESGVAQVVMISSLGADLPDRTGPIRDLHYLENRLRESDAPLRALRSSYFQENVAGVIPLAEREGIYPNFLPSADAEFPTVSVRDIGRLAARLLTSAPAREVVDVVGPVYSARQLAAALSAALGRPLRVVDVPPEERVAAFMRTGASPSVAEAYAEMFAGVAEGRFGLRGDRVERTATTIEQALRDLLAMRTPRPSRARTG